ncbi:hypothetical protein HBI87_007630 [Parastagonospora nodorum]|nr:hypothetical protein HBI87_007630 [Parastagonospora nodorum]
MSYWFIYCQPVLTRIGGVLESEKLGGQDSCDDEDQGAVPSLPTPGLGELWEPVEFLEEALRDLKLAWSGL